MTLNYNPNIGQLKIRRLLINDDLTRILAYSGARAGKTFEFVRSLILRAMLAPGSRHAIIRKHFSAAKKYIWLDTLPSVIKVCFPELEQTIEINKTDYFYKFENGSEIWIGGLDDKERADKILGGEYNTIYFNECSEISWSSVQIALTRLAKKSDKYFKGKKIDRLINKAYFDTNPPAKTHWSYRLFFEGQDPETRISINNISRYGTVHISTEDNLDNLSEDFIENLQNLTGSKKERFYHGRYQDEVEGALWSETIINQNREKKYPEFKKIVVAIDPAASNKINSDETGVVVAGKGTDKHYYILDDLSGHYSPNGWASKGILAYKKWRADMIVGERNNGGDMVETIILNQDSSIPVSLVWASRGKKTRAEPSAALYERGMVHHTKELVDLEYQMTSYIGEDGEDSPDRMDALVWALTELMTEKEKKTTDPETIKGMFY